MIRRRAFLLMLVVAPAVATAEPVTIAVRPAVRPLRQGTVVRLDVRTVANSRIARIEGTAFDRPIAFVVAAGGRTASGLLGIAADTEPGEYVLSIQGETATGGKIAVEKTIDVAKGVFRSQRLRVDPRFVEPPKDALARIEQERARLGELSHAVDLERPWQAPFAAPLSTAVSEPFGVRRTFNGQLASQHRGVDLRGGMGDPIAAPGAGRVVLAGDLYYTGNTVVIDHGAGVVSLLAHMSKVLVHEGDMVEQGTIVGEVGATGRVTGPHLHWTAWVGGVNVDPLSLVDAISPRPRPAARPRASSRSAP